MYKDKKLKVLLIPSDYWSGIGAMARHLAESVKDVDYYFFTTGEIKRHRAEFTRLVSGVDIVHWLANLSWTRLPPDIDLEQFPAANIATVHHVDEALSGFGEKEEAGKISAAGQCDVIHVVSQEWEGFVRSRTNTPVLLAHHAINPNQFKSNRAKNRPGPLFRIGTFGYAKELKDRKRTDVLLEALTILQAKGCAFELVFQGPHWSALQEPFAQLGIPVNNLGYLSNRQALRSYRLLDLYVCSSDVEGGPLPVLEALASGVPVVSTRVGVSIDALALGGGILVAKGDPAAMASAIASLIDDRALYQRFAQEAVRVAENFSWDRIGKEYLAMYRYALGAKACPPAAKPFIGFPKAQRAFQLAREAAKDSPFRKKLYQAGHLFLNKLRGLA